MTKLTDETLMYYADGLLSPSECEWVEKLLAADPELRSRLEIFRATGRSLSRLLEEDDGAPPPRKLLDFVAGLQPPPAGAKAPPAGVKPPNGRRGAPRSKEAQPALDLGGVAPSNARLASVAVLALVVGAALGWMGRSALPSGTGVTTDLVRAQGDRLVARGPLHDALETAPSGARTKLALSNGSNLSLVMKMTFRNEARKYCREYELSPRVSERYIAVACRADGVWTVQFQALSPPLAASGYVLTPASGRNSAIDAAVNALMDGDRLGGEDESALIRKGWRD